MTWPVGMWMVLSLDTFNYSSRAEPGSFIFHAVYRVVHSQNQQVFFFISYYSRRYFITPTFQRRHPISPKSTVVHQTHDYIYILFCRTQTSHINRLASESWTVASAGRGNCIRVSSLPLWRTFITSYFTISMTSRYGIVSQIRTIFGAVTAQRTSLTKLYDVKTASP